MLVGVTGHQDREGIDWQWVATQLDSLIASNPDITGAFSSLAKGSDQLFAITALKHRIPVVAVIPMRNYASYFRGDDAAEYHRILGKCKSLILDTSGTDEERFLAAGVYIATHCDSLFAIWDGLPAKGVGGTSDIYHYAIKLGKKVVHIDPIKRRVSQ